MHTNSRNPAIGAVSSGRWLSALELFQSAARLASGIEERQLRARRSNGAEYRRNAVSAVTGPNPAERRSEQKKIADCLGSLDDLIEAEGRKLEALRQHKQGLMQQLVPQPGETVPRLRFPEFEDNASEWENKKLGGAHSSPIGRNSTKR